MRQKLILKRIYLTLSAWGTLLLQNKNRTVSDDNCVTGSCKKDFEQKGSRKSQFPPLDLKIFSTWKKILVHIFQELINCRCNLCNGKMARFFSSNAKSWTQMLWILLCYRQRLNLPEKWSKAMKECFAWRVYSCVSHKIVV